MARSSRASGPAGSGPLTAVASKKGVTVVDIASTRMLMAHGFLRRIFEVFEQFKTPVDVVTTSEVSVSVTIDDTRRVPEIMAALTEVADVTREDDMAILCAVGDGLQNDPAFVGRLLEAHGRRAGAHAVAGRGAAEHHAGDRPKPIWSRRCGACTIDFFATAASRRVTNLLSWSATAAWASWSSSCAAPTIAASPAS